MKTRENAVLALVFATVTMAGCATTEPQGDAPALDERALSAQNQITNNGWTGNATTLLDVLGNTVKGQWVVSRSSGATTRSTGACVLTQAQQYVSNAWSVIPCTTASDCSAIPLPSGGHAYCEAPDATGQKTCWIRPGSQSGFCAGSPALGGQLVGPGTYTTPAVPAEYYNSIATTAQYRFDSFTWITQGCFAGCTTGNPPSNSTSVNEISSCSAGGYWWDGSKCWPDAQTWCTSSGHVFYNGNCYDSQEEADCQQHVDNNDPCYVPGITTPGYYTWIDGQCQCEI